MLKEVKTFNVTSILMSLNETIRNMVNCDTAGLPDFARDFDYLLGTIQENLRFREQILFLDYEKSKFF